MGRIHAATGETIPFPRDKAVEPVMPGFNPADIRALFQPIERMRTGQTVGFEALARLVAGDRLLPPAAFLARLAHADLEALFCAMLVQAMGLLDLVSTPSFRPYVSINLEPSVLIGDGFLERLRREVERCGYGGGQRLVIELLEVGEITDLGAVIAALIAVRTLGFGVALDDVGSAYASLKHMRELPVDFVKLDQSFARSLAERPEELHFALNIQSLAHGLGKRLVVEGVETADIHDALRVIGVELAQGYAIARPMPLEAVGPWLGGRQARDTDLAPTSMLGAFAGHLRVVEACRILMEQPLPLSWKDESKDPHACAIGRYFDRQGLHDTPLGQAHKDFHKVMTLYASDRVVWQDRADTFRKALICEIVGDGATV